MKRELSRITPSFLTELEGRDGGFTYAERNRRCLGRSVRRGCVKKMVLT
jgi:hypothetical protein